MINQDQVRALTAILLSEADNGTNDNLANLACALVEHYEWDIDPETIALCVESVLWTRIDHDDEFYTQCEGLSLDFESDFAISQH